MRSVSAFVVFLVSPPPQKFLVEEKEQAKRAKEKKGNRKRKEGGNRNFLWPMTFTNKALSPGFKREP